MIKNANIYLLSTKDVVADFKDLDKSNIPENKKNN